MKESSYVSKLVMALLPCWPQRFHGTRRYLCVFLLGLVVLGVEWQNEIFFFPPHQQEQKGKDKRESPLSVNERERIERRRVSFPGQIEK